MKEKNSTSRIAYVVLAILFLLVGNRALVFQGYLHEESQQLLFPFVIVGAYFLFRKAYIKIPIIIFASTLVVWMLIQVRIPLMYAFGMYEGRVVIGKLEGDDKGLEARSLLAELKRIGLTYSLPGPVLLPVSTRHGFTPSEWLTDTTKSPSLIVFGDGHRFQLHFPEPPSGRFLNVLVDEGFVVPSFIHSISVEREPLFAVLHFVSWVSAYFNSDINQHASARNDVLFEAAALRGISSESSARALVRLLLSYDRIMSEDMIANSYEFKKADVRLRQVVHFAEKKSLPRLYGYSLNLLSLLHISVGDVAGARHILDEYLSSSLLDSEYQISALHNVALIEGLQAASK